MTKKVKKNYRAWYIDEKDFPNKGTIKDKIKFLVSYGILAPSTHNTQPWIFEFSNNKLLIKPNTTRKLAVGDPDSFGLFISLGAFVENVKQAAKHFGLNAQTSIKDGHVTMEFNLDKHKLRLIVLSNIKNRHSHKLPHDPKPVSQVTVSKLKRLSYQTIKTHIITNKKDFKKLTDIHVNSAKAISNNKYFTYELIGWLRTNRSKAYTGMPGFVVGNSQIKSLIGKIILKKKPELLSKLAENDRDLLKSSSAIVVFSVPKQQLKPEDLIKAGQEIENFWLILTELGLVAHPLFASIQHKPSASKLKQILKTDRSPVFFMRIGYSKNKHYHTPRENYKWNY